jgi:thioredoxin 1
MLDRYLFNGSQAFDRLKVDSDKITLIIVGAPNCATCEILKPLLHQIAGENRDRVNLVELDAIADVKLTLELEVRSVPMTIVYHQNLIIERIFGVKPKRYYTEIIDRVTDIARSISSPEPILWYEI